MSVYVDDVPGRAAYIILDPASKRSNVLTRSEIFPVWYNLKLSCPFIVKPSAARPISGSTQPVPFIWQYRAVARHYHGVITAGLYPLRYLSAICEVLRIIIYSASKPPSRGVASMTGRSSGDPSFERYAEFIGFNADLYAQGKGLTRQLVPEPRRTH
jgi:hypothetical protein